MVDIRSERRGVLVGMVTAAVITAVAFGLSVTVSSDETLAVVDRLTMALHLSIILFLWLAAAIGNVARLRFFRPESINGAAFSDDDMDLRAAQAILQNTLEQTLLAFGAQVAMSTVFPDPRAGLVALVVLFSTGRVLFWAGYADGAARRALGFGLTFYPSLAVLLVSGLVVVSRLVY
ncbi:MAPEG family protein [uncultured Litoreibacter sp.]|uniref:MAPEG family protein n=1 Tax=uncultured Litoreibacter sp. TaxID=1392394 RepID=UPI00345A24BD